jgi:small conductance mechanosensitive channel
MQIKEKITEFLVTYGIQIVGALIIFIAGLLLARWVGSLIQRWLDRLELEPPVKTLIVRVARLLIIVLTLVLVLDKFGVPIAPMVAGIGVVGVGIGLAMQGVLANLSAGLLIIFTKPFRVGEYIELIGVEGQVKNIDLFTTTLLHADLSRVVIPNRKIVGEILHNYARIRQVDLRIGVAYGTDLNQLDAVIADILQHNARVLKDPAPVCGIATLDDSSIALSIKPWVAVNDYGAAGGELYRAVLDRFKVEGIEMPFPQREIRFLNEPSAKAA